jgi:hypothetical protein
LSVSGEKVKVQLDPQGRGLEVNQTRDKKPLLGFSRMFSVDFKEFEHRH